MPLDPETRDRIGTASEIHISSYRRDGSLRRWTPIWVVQVGDDLYVRSAYGTEGGWYRWATAEQLARVRVDGFETDVALRPASDADTNAAVDAAYTEKYRSQPSALAPMVAETAAATTTRLEPAPA
ncbi:hypothetical protein ATK30_8241 [Amycolatopsis echigonensis]|uniref:DUF2255 family protein n=1 Tax=Amycolatopsis echigonensis TaxID=2576905 RepID=A0A2N3WTR5_9PSEU|nr:DUF2255 family protein [Amycolatopsis niigatensis]PKV97266.1 hypothetical protein ATK30_8241 [Amycolatopsis niigatensis]